MKRHNRLITVLACVVALVAVALYMAWQNSAVRKCEQSQENSGALQLILARYTVDHDAAYPNQFSEAVAQYGVLDPATGSMLPVNPYTGEPVAEISRTRRNNWGDYIYLKFIEDGEIVWADVFCFSRATSRQPAAVHRYTCRSGHMEGIKNIFGVHPDNFLDAARNPDKYGIHLDFDDCSFLDFSWDEWEADFEHNSLYKIASSPATPEAIDPEE